ncbi:MAG: peptidoglycan-binding protein [Labilithrix sp.]|nr:peptidoglycan-binding protein [Labilithrix sp.]
MTAYRTPATELIAKINAWADAVANAGYQPGLYIGSPQPLTGKELYALKVVRYWKAPARVVDRFGELGEPNCGYCMYQLWPEIHWPSNDDPNRVWVDVDFIQQDYKGRVPSWVVASPDGIDLSTVRGVQTRLKELGFDPGSIDGVVGPKTRAALVAFQESRGLTPDGVVGPKTQEALAIPS